MCGYEFYYIIIFEEFDVFLVDVVDVDGNLVFEIGFIKDNVMGIFFYMIMEVKL